MKLSPFNPLKVLCWRDRIEAILDGEIPPPVAVEIDPSNRCTSDCVWCMFDKFRKMENVDLDKEIMKNLIEDLQSDVRAITFTGGGEPLLNPHTLEMMELSKKLGVQVGLVTNGDLLGSQEIRSTILDTCRYCRVSLDAGTDETHYRLHRPPREDQLSRTIESMRELVTEEMTLGAAYLIHPENFNEVGILADKIEGIVDYLQIRPCLGVQLNREHLNWVNDYFEQNTYSFDLFLNLKRFDEIRYGMKFEKCRATPLLGIVGADAKVYLCCQFRGNEDFVIGNLKENDFFEIWGSERHREVIESIDLEKCPPCRYSNFNKIFEEVFLNDKMHRCFL